MGLKDLFNKVKDIIKPKKNDVQVPEYTIEDEIAKMESYTAPNGYIFEEKIREEHKGDINPMISDEVYFMILGYGNEKLPTNYFSKLVNKCRNAINRNAFAFNYVTSMLCRQAKTFVVDENGEVKDRINKLTSKEIISFEDNPVLAYASKFDFFELNSDACGDSQNKLAVFMHVINFLAAYSGTDESVPINKNVLKENAWLLDKNTYYNKLNMVKDLKEFLKYCCEMSSDEGFRIMYNNL